MLDPVLKEPTSIRMIALQTLWSFMDAVPRAKYALAIGWYHEEYPLLDLEADLIGLTLEDTVEQTDEEDY